MEVGVKVDTRTTPPELDNMKPEDFARKAACVTALKFCSVPEVCEKLCAGT